MPIPKMPYTEKEKCDIFYEIPCWSCEANHKIVDSALVQHAEKYDHKIKWVGAKIIDQEPDYRKLLFLESWEINKKT